MKIILIVILAIFTVSCETAKVKNETYKVSDSTIELGSIGHAKSVHNTNNSFLTRSFPVLENKIRLDIQILPFTEELNKIYNIKAAEKQLQVQKYFDSIAKKPEFVAITIADLTTFTGELNASYNKHIATYLKDTKKTQMVTAVAISLLKDDINKIKLADTYYLVNIQDKKYTIVLYKDGKRTGAIDLNSGVVLAYTLGKFCWSANEKDQWYIGDIVKDNKSCSGKTRSRIKAKKQENLFKM